MANIANMNVNRAIKAVTLTVMGIPEFTHYSDELCFVHKA